MPFKRKIYDKLLDWKNEFSGKKALLIEGARRIGKSTIVEEFGRNEYKTYLLIDFNDISPLVTDCFENHLNDLDTFYMLLSTEYGKELHNRQSLIIFDEIQRYPKARQSIKKLVQDGRYDFIETGSLISIHENVKDITIPSEERTLNMYSMDFEEFCWALGEEKLTEYIRTCFEKQQPLEQPLHNKAMLLFKQFMLVGGMPKALDLYLSSAKNFNKSDAEKRDIITLYREDIMKIGVKYRSKVLSIFDGIPGFLSQHEKRIVFNEIEDGSFFTQYADTFFWLADSRIVNECFKCNDPNIGLSLNENRSYVKCYMGDTGLLVSHAFSENEITKNELYKQIFNDKLSINEGMLYENAIAQILVANGHKLFFYTHYNESTHKNDIEIDFILSNQSKTQFKITPIEVKSTTKYQFNSLKTFTSKFRERIGCSYIIHPKNLSIKKDEQTGIEYIAIPPYMTSAL